MKPPKRNKIALIVVLILMPVLINGCTLGGQCLIYGMKIALQSQTKPPKEKKPGGWMHIGKPHKHERPRMVSKSFDKDTQRTDRKIAK